MEFLAPTWLTVFRTWPTESRGKNSMFRRFRGPCKCWLTLAIELYQHSEACQRLALDLPTIQQVQLCLIVFLLTTRRVRSGVSVL